MTVTTFIPQLWAASLQKNLYNEHVYASCVNRDYEGEIKGMGSSVRINTMGPVTIRDYTRNTDIAAPDDIDMADMILPIDTAKYFHFAIDDVDKRQARGDFKSDAMREAAQAMAETVDDYLAALINAGVDGTANDITNGTPLTVGQGSGEIDAYGLLVRMGVILANNNTPLSNRWAVLPPFMEGQLHLDARFVSFGTQANRETARGAPIGRLANFEIHISNNCPAGATTSVVALAGYKGAVSYAEQLEEMNAYRPERRFADAVKGLHVWGGKVTRPSNLAAAEVIAGAYY